MAFNGTENFEKQELISYLETIGMEFGPEINAYTNFDETVYMLTVPTDDPEYIEQGFRILADWSRRISLDEEEVERERGVVLDEWRGRLGAGQRIFDQESKLTYAGSRYADRLPIGDPDIIENATAAPLRRFYEDWYRPELMAVVAVGDFDAERILELIHDNFDEDWGPGDEGREPIISEVEPHEATLTGLFEDPELTRSSSRILLKYEEPPVRTLADYREGTVSRLTQGLFGARLRELIDHNEAEFTSGRIGWRRISPGWTSWTLSASAADGELPIALEQVLMEWQRVRDHGFTSTELERQKTSILRYSEARWKDRENQDSSRLARRLTSVFIGRSIMPGPDWTLETYRQILPGITLDDLQLDVDALDFGREQSRVIFTNTPEIEGLAPPTEAELRGAVAAAANAAPEAWVDTVSESPLVSGLPEPGSVVDEQYDADLDLTTWTLSNGVRVLIKPTDFNDDRFSLEAFSPGGRSLGSTDVNYSQDLASTVIPAGGAGEFDAAALRKRLTGTLADARPWINTFMEGFSGGGSPDDLETALQLLWLKATHPRKDQAAFDSLMERYATMLENRALNPDQVFADSVSVILHDYDPRALPIQAAALETVDLDSSLAFYAERFEDLDDLVVVLVGDLDLDELRVLAGKYLATLPSTDREESWRDIGPHWIEGPLHRVIGAGMDEKARTTLLMHGDAEWMRLNRYSIGVLASALQIRLREILREDMSGTYGVSVSGSISPWPEPTWRMTISFGCEPARLDELVAETTAVLEQVRDEGLETEYLEKVQAQNLRSHEENIRTNRYWVSVLGFRDRYGLDQREELDTLEFLNAFGEDDLQAAAGRYIQLDRLIRLDKVPAP
jgi:zinc protease